MSVFSDAEIQYLGSQRLGRLATVGHDGMPHVVPVAFRYNPDTDTIDIGGHHFAQRKKFRDVRRTGMFPLVEADAEEVPLPDASFDLVVSEYGASVWCDPERWVGEAARLLRPGGRLVFLTNSVLVTLCVPGEEGFAQEHLVRPQRALNKVEWPGGGVEFHPSHGEWIRVLRANGFAIEALRELYARADGATHQYYSIATAHWAMQWPVEDLWAARLTR